MEADWSAEIAPGLPEIIVPWSAEPLAEDPTHASGETLAWCDLRHAGHHLEAAIQSIPSAAAEPALAAALRTLHSPGSSWFTSKCDLWTTTPADPDSPDPYEFDAADLAPAPLHLCASYIDMLATDPALFASFAAHKALLDTLVAALRAQPQPHARVDLVLRAARIDNSPGFAVTAYAAGCGLTAADAHRAWQLALDRLIAALHS
jgi:hypothetical protein